MRRLDANGETPSPNEHSKSNPHATPEASAVAARILGTYADLDGLGRRQIIVIERDIVSFAVPVRRIRLAVPAASRTRGRMTKRQRLRSAARRLQLV
jgi:hypothetical protein